MKKVVLYILTLLVISTSSIGQSSLTEKALNAYKSGELTQAKEYILDALKDEKTSTDSRTWNFKGHIFKEIYKTSGLDPNSKDRKVAVNAFIKSSQISDSSKYHLDNCKALEYLSATYFNDAIKGAIDVRYDSETDAVEHFEEYRTIKKWLDPEVNITREELQFLKILAQGFEVAHYEGNSEDGDYLNKAVSNYKEALKIDSLDYEANFNLAIVYYNEGAELIRAIDYTTGFIELLEIQKNCVNLFKQALPYMEKADEIRPDRIESLKGLMFIHRALNDFDTYLSYKVKLDKIVKER